VEDNADELGDAVEEELDNGTETSTVTGGGETSIIEYPVVVTVTADSVLVVWTVDINIEVLPSWVRVSTTV